MTRRPGRSGHEIAKLILSISNRSVGGQMSEQRPVHEEPREEEHKVYVLLAIPVFLVTIFIIGLIAMLGTSPRP
jgi:hypothetical protein